jgi:transcriptional regulator
MHTYPRFAAPSQRAITELVRQHPFAIVVSARPGQAPTASHLPLILPPGVDPEASLVGVQMLGHMGRKNPHWQQIAEVGTVLLIFSSSHGYVSPQLYDFSPCAPTLDYAAVHLTGHAELIESTAGALDVVTATIDALEDQRPTRWDATASREYHQRIVAGVVAFRVRITDQQAMFKLSQDMSETTRANVREDFDSGPRRHPELVQLMDQVKQTRS